MSSGKGSERAGREQEGFGSSQAPGYGSSRAPGDDSSDAHGFGTSDIYNSGPEGGASGRKPPSRGGSGEEPHPEDRFAPAGEHRPTEYERTEC